MEKVRRRGAWSTGSSGAPHASQRPSWRAIGVRHGIASFGCQPITALPPVSVHPRACGERRWRPALVAGEPGSSPRMQGTVLRVRFTTPSKRFIPAHAGNGSQIMCPGQDAAVHPRACGERSNSGAMDRSRTGSSPRVRGTGRAARRTGSPRRFIPARAGNGVIASVVSYSMRFIPARAGNGNIAQNRTTNKSVHPRACGERVASSVAAFPVHGSSPRMRGTGSDYCPDRRPSRFIPAHAGNGVPTHAGNDRSTVHPRACGGTGWTIDGEKAPRRFIPARAGNGFRRAGG